MHLVKALTRRRVLRRIVPLFARLPPIASALAWIANYLSDGENWGIASHPVAIFLQAAHFLFSFREKGRFISSHDVWEPVAIRRLVAIEELAEANRPARRRCFEIRLIRVQESVGRPATQRPGSRACSRCPKCPRR